MCARFVVMDDKEIAEINSILRDISMKFDGRGLVPKTGEVYPTDNVAVLTLEKGKPTLDLMRWGLPKWDGKGVVINARSEGIEDKKMFRQSFWNRRMVVPCTGYFEWQKVDGKGKVKYLFNEPSSPMVYMAGIYTPQEEGLARFSILTRDANAYVRDVHDRMPVLLYKHELARWLGDYGFAQDVLRRDGAKLIKVALQGDHMQ